MKTLSSRLLSAALAVSLMYVFLPSAQAVTPADILGPELVSVIRTTPPILDANSPDAAIEVNATDASDIVVIQVQTRHVSAHAQRVCNDGFSYTSGPAPWTVPICGYDPTGNFGPESVVVESLHLSDQWGNTTVFTDRSVLDLLGYRIENPPIDDAAPTLLSVEVLPTPVVPGTPATLRIKYADASAHAWAYPQGFMAMVSDEECCGVQIDDKTTDHGDGTFARDITYRTGIDTPYGSYRIPALLMGDRHGNEATIDPQISIVVADDKHPVGDLRITGDFAIGSTVSAQTSCSTLSGKNSCWDPAAVLDYKWFRDGYVALPGSSKFRISDPTWTQTRVNVKVTATWPDGTVRTRLAGSESIGSGTLKLPRPTIATVPAVGRKVTLNYPELKEPEYLGPVTQEYQWLRDAKPIPGATARSYTPVALDNGTMISVRIVSKVYGYYRHTATSASAKVAAGTLSAPVPTLFGGTRVGERLRAASGAWTTGVALAYQWQRNGINITGATSATYLATSADKDQAIRVRITGRKAGYITAVKHSQIRKISIGVLLAPTPHLAQAPAVGTKSTITIGSWTAGTAVKYQWQRNGKNIYGATKSSYVPVAADANNRLRVRITGAKPGYATAVRFSKEYTTATGMLRSGKATLTGTAKVGSTLSINPGKWTSGTTLSYRWTRNGTWIPKAYSKSYKLTPKDRGTWIEAYVIGSKNGYTGTATKTVRVKIK